MVAATVLMAGCNKDDDEKTTNNGSTNTESSLLDNQAALNGDVIDVESSVDYQINDGSENRYFVDASNREAGLNIRFDLYESIVGKIVDLANPQSAGTDISIMVDMEGIFLNQEIHPGDATTDPYIGYNGNINGDEFDAAGSMFKSGTLKVSHTQEFGFILVCSGVLFNDMKLDLRIVVPQSEIDIQHSSK